MKIQATIKVSPKKSIIRSNLVNQRRTRGCTSYPDIRVKDNNIIHSEKRFLNALPLPHL